MSKSTVISRSLLAVRSLLVALGLMALAPVASAQSADDIMKQAAGAFVTVKQDWVDARLLPEYQFAQHAVYPKVNKSLIRKTDQAGAPKFICQGVDFKMKWVPGTGGSNMQGTGLREYKGNGTCRLVQVEIFQFASFKDKNGQLQRRAVSYYTGNPSGTKGQVLVRAPGNWICGRKDTYACNENVKVTQQPVIVDVMPVSVQATGSYDPKTQKFTETLKFGSPYDNTALKGENVCPRDPWQQGGGPCRGGLVCDSSGSYRDMATPIRGGYYWADYLGINANLALAPLSAITGMQTNYTGGTVNAAAPDRPGGVVEYDGEDRDVTATEAAVCDGWNPASTGAPAGSNLGVLFAAEAGLAADDPLLQGQAKQQVTNPGVEKLSLVGGTPGEVPLVSEPVLRLQFQHQNPEFIQAGVLVACGLNHKDLHKGNGPLVELKREGDWYRIDQRYAAMSPQGGLSLGYSKYQPSLKKSDGADLPTSCTLSFTPYVRGLHGAELAQKYTNVFHFKVDHQKLAQVMGAQQIQDVAQTLEEMKFKGEQKNQPKQGIQIGRIGEAPAVVVTDSSKVCPVDFVKDPQDFQVQSPKLGEPIVFEYKVKNLSQDVIEAGDYRLSLVLIVSETGVETSSEPRLIDLPRMLPGEEVKRSLPAWREPNKPKPVWTPSTQVTFYESTILGGACRFRTQGALHHSKFDAKDYFGAAAELSSPSTLALKQDKTPKLGGMSGVLMGPARLKSAGLNGWQSLCYGNKPVRDSILVNAGFQITSLQAVFVDRAQPDRVLEGDEIPDVVVECEMAPDRKYMEQAVCGSPRVRQYKATSDLDWSAKNLPKNADFTLKIYPKAYPTGDSVCAVNFVVGEADGSASKKSLTLKPGQLPGADQDKMQPQMQPREAAPVKPAAPASKFQRRGEARPAAEPTPTQPRTQPQAQPAQPMQPQPMETQKLEETDNKTAPASGTNRYGVQRTAPQQTQPTR